MRCSTRVKTESCVLMQLTIPLLGSTTSFLARYERRLRGAACGHEVSKSRLTGLYPRGVGADAGRRRKRLQEVSQRLIGRRYAWLPSLETSREGEGGCEALAWRFR